MTIRSVLGLGIVLSAASLGLNPGCSSAESKASAAQAGVIDHLSPRPDSVGAAPARFEWTKAAGAEYYVLSVWNEVDVLVWRQDVRATGVAAPKEWDVEPGTYFWAVVGFRADGRPVAESGLAAFVVRDSDRQVG